LSFEPEAIERESYCSSWGYCSKGQVGNMKHDNFTANPNMVNIGTSIISDASAGENHTIFTDSQSIYA